MYSIGPAIRVFGIYSHAQLDKRLWDSMGYQLWRKGREYQRRYVSFVDECAPPNLTFISCTFRADPVHKGDKVVPPATFPPTPPPDRSMISDELPTISDEVLEEVCQNPSDDSLLICTL